MSKPKFKTPYDLGNTDHSVALKGSQKLPDGTTTGRTKQQFKDESDINTIVKKIMKTGVMPENVNQGLAQYGEFDSLPDYQEMRNRIAGAQQLFDALPSKTRAELHNDPQRMIALSETEDGRAQLVKLGLGKMIQPESKASGSPTELPKPSPSSTGPKAPKKPVKTETDDE